MLILYEHNSIGCIQLSGDHPSLRDSSGAAELAGE